MKTERAVLLGRDVGLDGSLAAVCANLCEELLITSVPAAAQLLLWRGRSFLRAERISEGGFLFVEIVPWVLPDAAKESS